MSDGDCVVEIRGGVATCIVCGRSVPTAKTDPRKVNMVCKKPGEPRPKPPAAPEPRSLCKHRGPKLRDQEATLCGFRGMVFPVFACDLHEACTETRVCPKSTIRHACSTCPDWTS